MNIKFRLDDLWFIWVINWSLHIYVNCYEGISQKWSLENIYELYLGVKSFFQAYKFVQTSINWYYESWCTGQDQVFDTYLMSYKVKAAVTIETVVFNL